MLKVRRAAAGFAGPKRPSVELEVPAHFRCPVSLELMKDPVTTSTGITYDRQSIETWLADMGGSTCPVTNQPVATRDDFIPNHALRRRIQDWCVAHRSHGVDRIPTPRIPVTRSDASEALKEVASSGETGDRAKCRDSVGRIKRLAKESERNRRCFSSSGAGLVLAGAFDAFVRRGGGSGRDTTGILEEILSALVLMLPLDKAACHNMRSRDSLSSLVRISRHGDLSGRLNAVLAVRELVDPEKGDNTSGFADVEGLPEALIKLIKEPISPPATKAALLATYYLVSGAPNEKPLKQRFAELGIVHLLLEVLVDAEKSTSEKALGVLDSLLDSKKGTESALGHALAVPVLVKKMLRVSDLATEFAVSGLWKLCRDADRGGVEGGGGYVAEALRVGAFQKLLLLLQIGCREGTKQKASELLKLLNGKRSTVECIESGDFRGLKRAF